MTRDKLTETLDKWKKDVDPENRKKDYSITNSIISNQEELTIEIKGNEICKINFSINEFDKVIFEYNENNKFSGFVTLKNFRKYLFAL